MLLVFVAFIAMINYFFNWVGYQTHLNNIIASNTPYNGLSLEMILGTVFSPVMWLAGIAKEDVMLMGQLLGIKLSSSEFVAYTQLATLKDMTSAPHQFRLHRHSNRWYRSLSPQSTQNPLSIRLKSRYWGYFSFSVIRNYRRNDYRVTTLF